MTARRRPSVEDERLVVMHDDAILEMQLDCPCKSDTFNIAANTLELLEIVPVRNGLDALRNDGAVVEALSHIVGCCPNDLHASLEGAAIRVRADEGGQERMVDVDDRDGDLVQKLAGEDLHVSGENEHIDMTAEQLE